MRPALGLVLLLGAAFLATHLTHTPNHLISTGKHGAIVLTPNVVELGRLAEALGVEAKGADAARRLARALDGPAVLQKGRVDVAADAHGQLECEEPGFAAQGGGAGEHCDEDVGRGGLGSESDNPGGVRLLRGVCRCSWACLPPVRGIIHMAPSVPPQRVMCYRAAWQHSWHGFSVDRSHGLVMGRDRGRLPPCWPAMDHP